MMKIKEIFKGKKETPPGLEIVDPEKIEENWRKALEQLKSKENINKAVGRFKEILLTIGSIPVISLIFEKSAEAAPTPVMQASVVGEAKWALLCALAACIGGAIYLFKKKEKEAKTPPEPQPPFPTLPKDIFDLLNRLRELSVQAVQVPEDYLLSKDLINKIPEIKPEDIQDVNNAVQFVQFVGKIIKGLEDIIEKPVREGIPRGIEAYLAEIRGIKDSLENVLGGYKIQLDHYEDELRRVSRVKTLTLADYAQWTKRVVQAAALIFCLRFIFPLIWSEVATLLGLPVRAERVETLKEIETGTRSLEVTRHQLIKEREIAEEEAKLGATKEKALQRERLIWEKEIKKLQLEIKKLEREMVSKRPKLPRKKMIEKREELKKRGGEMIIRINQSPHLSIENKVELMVKISSMLDELDKVEQSK